MYEQFLKTGLPKSSWGSYLSQARMSIEKAFAVRHGLTRCKGIICLAHLFVERPCSPGHEGDGLPHIPPGYNHGSLWKRDGQPVAYVFQPYKDAMTTDVRARLTEFCQEHGLIFTILEDESFHNPGETTLVMIERAQ